MSEPKRRPSWPVALWSLQLVPAAAIVAFGALCHARGVRSIALAALVIGAVWCLITVLLLARSRRWIVTRRRELALAWVTTIVLVAVTDLVLSASGFVPSIEDHRRRSISYSVGSTTGYRMVPQEVIVDGGPPISINRRGFRGPEIDTARPSGQKLIVFLGGSQVFDHRGGDWATASGAILRERGHDVAVVNAGVPGHTSTESFAKLLTDVWLLGPDIVVVCHTWNDIKYFRRLSPDEPYRGLPPAEPVGWTRDWRLHPTGVDRWLTVSSLYRHLRFATMRAWIGEEGLSVLHRPTDPADPAASAEVGMRQFELNLAMIAELAQAVGSEVTFCHQARLFRGEVESGKDVEAYLYRNTRYGRDDLERVFHACDSLIAHVAGDVGADIIDMRGLDDPAYFWDPIHFNQRGSRAAAVLVADELERRYLSSASPR